MKRLLRSQTANRIYVLLAVVAILGGIIASDWARGWPAGDGSTTSDARH